jgi:hypothetical protein
MRRRWLTEAQSGSSRYLASLICVGRADSVEHPARRNAATPTIRQFLQYS